MKWIWMIGMLTLVACNEDFLATRPTDQLGQEEALATDKNIYAAINGMHRKMVAQYMGNQACGG